MNQEQYAIWQEMLELIARYDWAVEGYSAPFGVTLSREAAIEIRGALVVASRELTA